MCRERLCFYNMQTLIFPVTPADAALTAAVTNSKTMSANNTSAQVPIFGITGVVRITKLYGIVTTALLNHTGMFLRVNDQTAQVNLTLSTIGATLTNFSAGSYFSKTALAATLATVQSSAAGRLVESATAGVPLDSQFVVVQKNGAATNIEYCYATTDAPTSGVIAFTCEYEPLSSTGAIIAL